MAHARTNLRPDPTAFVGRAADLARVAAALASARLVSVTGPPGVGKTRLSKELALALEGSVWFTDLSGAAGVESLVSRLAEVLDVPLSGGR